MKERDCTFKVVLYDDNRINNQTETLVQPIDWFSNLPNSCNTEVNFKVAGHKTQC